MVTRWLVILSLMVPLTAWAEDDAQRALQLYNDMKFPKALKLVNQVLRSPKAGPDQLRTAYQVQGLCFAARGKSKQAVAAFRRLLALDPGYSLPASVSPKFRPPFEKAQELSENQAGLVLIHQPPKAPKNLSGLALELELMANPFRMAKAVRLLYWAPDGKRQWAGAKIRRAGKQTIKLPKTLKADRIEYYFEVTNKFGGVLALSGSREQPFKLDLTAAPVVVAKADKPVADEKPPVAEDKTSSPEPADDESEPAPKLVTKTDIPDVSGSAALDPVDQPPPEDDQQNGSAAWYQTWWFWTGVGVVVAGVATGVALGMSGDEPSGDIEYRIYLR